MCEGPAPQAPSPGDAPPEGRKSRKVLKKIRAADKKEGLPKGSAPASAEKKEKP